VKKSAFQKTHTEGLKASQTNKANTTIFCIQMAWLNLSARTANLPPLYPQKQSVKVKVEFKNEHLPIHVI
jgi:hypothetical protein